MQHKSLNGKDFGLIGVLVVLVVLAAVGGAGVYVYHRDHKAKMSTTTTGSTDSNQTIGKMSTSTDPYAGWKSFTTAYDKLSFKYPTNWQLTDQSSTNDTDVAPGQDAIALVSNDGLAITIGTGGTTFDGGNPGVSVLSSTPVKMLGGTHYLVFTSSDSGTTGGALVTTTNAVPSVSNLPTSKNIRLSNPAVTGLPAPLDIIDVEYNQQIGSNIHYPLSKFQQDSNFKIALEILESMAY